jgi:hypothetical protein
VELEETIDWGGTRVLLRPIKPEDGAQHRAFLAALTPDDLRDIGDAASNIPVVGARYPESMEKMTGR